MDLYILKAKELPTDLNHIVKTGFSGKEKVL